jgi:integrase/recombinase XerD
VTSLGNPVQQEKPALISNDDVDKYFALRDIEGISSEWSESCKRCLRNYLNYVHWKVDFGKTLDYCKMLKEKLSLSTYRKRIYQIRKYLTYLGIGWAENIKLPAEPEYLPHRITQEQIHQTIQYFNGHKYFKQLKAIILLGASSGMRAEELYQLEPCDIDIDNRLVHINHNPKNGQSTKTKKSRISYFNEEAQKTLIEYLTYFNEGGRLKRLFYQNHIFNNFKGAPIHVKDLRKFFSQEWDRRGGPTSIKKILMGHSLKGDVDLMHYNCQSEEDLKKIYDKVMGGVGSIQYR